MLIVVFRSSFDQATAEVLGMEDFCDAEVERAFGAIDVDGNGVIDEEEAQQLLEDVYVAGYGR